MKGRREKKREEKKREKEGEGGGEKETTGSRILHGTKLSVKIHKLPTVTYPSNIWVAGLGVNAMVTDDVLEGIIHQSSVTPLVPLGTRAVNQVLFAQRDKLTGFVEVLSLERASGTEGPAGSTLTLCEGEKVCVSVRVHVCKRMYETWQQLLHPQKMAPM